MTSVDAVEDRLAVTVVATRRIALLDRASLAGDQRMAGDGLTANRGHTPGHCRRSPGWLFYLNRPGIGHMALGDKASRRGGRDLGERVDSGPSVISRRRRRRQPSHPADNSPLSSTSAPAEQEIPPATPSSRGLTWTLLAGWHTAAPSTSTMRLGCEAADRPSGKPSSPS
jgi:hypothetical protein